MTSVQAKEAVKKELERYLGRKGINTQKPFRCMNPDHTDNNPSMSLDRNRNKAHCFSCGADYDIFDIIGFDYGLEGAELFSKAYDLFNIDIDQKERVKGRITLAGCGTESHGLSAYYTECKKRISGTDYPQIRGISSEVTERFNLGYDPSYVTNTGKWKVLIIPTGEESYLARNADSDADKRSRYRKKGASLTFNSEALFDAKTPIFVTEGEFDALSVMSVGGEAVALGSTANIRGFLNLCRTKRPVQPLIIALDNDKDGERATEELAEGLLDQIISFYRANAYGEYKDANEALLDDREAFSAAVENASLFEEEALNAEKDAYLKNNAAAHVDEFLKRLAENIDTPSITIGFASLDKALDGGLYEDLYIVGAISSLGKTTLITQLADQVADVGTDVLIFSLEMARSELIAKSISRETIITVLQTGGNVRNAKTARGISTRKRYENYSETEIRLIDEAILAYKRYAPNIYISEGIGDIGAHQIRETVQKHISITGKRPVVIVDYLQILASHSDRATDKQNTDKAILELKRISRDFKIPLIGISSFNRANYREAVTMEAFKESGAIEYSSDVLIGLQLRGAGSVDFNATEEKRKNPREIELVILKNRNGPIGGRVLFEYYPMFNYFRES